MIVDDNNNNIHIKILELNEKTIPNKTTIPKKKIEPTQIETKNILENVLPLTEKQRAEVELFKKLINS